MIATSPTVNETAIRLHVGTPLARDFGLQPASDFFAVERRTEYLIDGILAAGQPAVFGGPEKSFKTLQLLDLAISLASGKPFLGKFQVKRRARVGFFSGESGEVTIDRKSRLIAAAKGITDPRDLGDYLHITETLPVIPDDSQDLAVYLKDRRIEVCIVDPTYLALNPDVAKYAGNMFVMGQALGAFGDACRSADCVPVLAHHLNQSPKLGEAPLLRHLAFSGLPQWARQWLLVNHRKPWDATLKQASLILSVGGSAGHSSRWDLDISELDDDGKDTWLVEIDSGTTTTKHKHRAAVLKYLHSILSTPAGGDTASCIRDRCGMQTNDATAVITELSGDGLIESHQVRKKKTSYPGYRITTKGTDLLGTREYSGMRIPD